MALELVVPATPYLDGYVDALTRGWSPDNVGGEATARAHLAKITEDPAAFLATQDDPEARAGDLTLPDGSKVERLPGFHRWLWDGAFCGVIGFRWARGTAALPAHVLGHVGYAVTPWKRGRGYATLALAQILVIAKEKGLPWVELTTDPDNLPSQKVILANGGVLVERFAKPEAYGGAEALRFRIDIDMGGPHRR